MRFAPFAPVGRGSGFSKSLKLLVRLGSELAYGFNYLNKHCLKSILKRNLCEPASADKLNKFCNFRADEIVQSGSVPLKDFQNASQNTLEQMETSEEAQVNANEVWKPQQLPNAPKQTARLLIGTFGVSHGNTSLLPLPR